MVLSQNDQEIPSELQSLVERCSDQEFVSKYGKSNLGACVENRIYGTCVRGGSEVCQIRVLYHVMLTV